VRVALIGPVPPALGGATPGGVATHQGHLAEGLSRLPDVHVSLLATNARGAVWMPSLPYELIRPCLPERPAQFLAPRYVARVGAERLLRYVVHLARSPAEGSRREVLGQLLAYRAFLSEAHADVVHVQHPLERTYYVRLLAQLERRRWPLVVTAHSFFGEHADAVIHNFMAPNLRAADRVIAVSPHIAEQAAALGVDPGRIRVIRSGIDVERYQPASRPVARAALGLGTELPLILFVGNLEPRKQVDVLLRALAQVRAQVPNAALVVIGSGESAGVGDQTVPLLNLTRELGLDAAVRWVGRVDDTELMRWYAAADVFALPSSSEAQGIVALEAMACGLPVVVSAVGGLIGTVEDGQTGYLVPPGAVEPLAQRLVELLCDPQRREAIGHAARAFVTREFSWQRAVEATTAVYREMLACPDR
jgi:glycosyltransferase involved in cell wall biosynthesis